MDALSAVLESNYRFPNPLDATGLPPFFRHVASIFNVDYTLPSLRGNESPEITHKLSELLHWTNWSRRKLARVIGSTHPTVLQALDGNAGALSRSAPQRQRLDDVYAVVSRIYLLAGRSPERAARALATTGMDGTTATKHLMDGRMSEAYLTAMRAIRPAQSGSMLVGSYPLDARRASVAVLDED